MPGIACRMMSSRLGLVAEVIATESPSQLRPVVIHRTCAVTASVFLCSANARTSPSRLLSLAQQIRGSGSPTSWSITRLPPKLVCTSTIPGGSVRTSPISAASSQPGTLRSASQRLVGRLGRDERDQLALVRDVHRVDPEDLGGAGHRRAAPGSSPSRTIIATDEARASSLSTEATPPRVASRMQRSSGPTALEQRVDGGPQRARVGLDRRVELELVAREHDRRAVLADAAREQDPVAGPQRRRATGVARGSRRPMPVVQTYMPSAWPRSTTFVSPATICTPAAARGRARSPRPRRAGRRPPAPPRGSATGSAPAAARPATARSLTVPLTASSPIEPPGKRSGLTT